MQLLREGRGGDQAVVDRHHGDSVGGQRSDAPHAVVSLVAAAPPSPVDVDGDRRISLCRSVDVECTVRSVVRGEDQVLVDPHLGHLPGAFPPGWRTTSGFRVTGYRPTSGWEGPS